MEPVLRHRRAWKLLSALISRPLRRMFRYTPEPCPVDGPCLVIPNHATDYDPLLVALSFPAHPLYYVASEHIFRWGVLSALIRWAVDPIPRRKGASGADTVLACMRRLRRGASVCLFAEGDSTWTGESGRVFASTGKLAKASGASLVTYRLEGGYLSAPRWGKGIRRGEMRGHAVNVYSPAQLQAMTPAEINRAIERDIAESIWVRQAASPVAYRGKAAAEHLETALFLCPQCRRVGTLASRGDAVFCACGFRRQLTSLGGFAPAEPFANPAQWDVWQMDALARGDFLHDKTLFSDENVTLSALREEHAQRRLTRGTLRQTAQALTLGGYAFLLAEIDSMSLAQTRALLFSHRGAYYELRAGTLCCLRKYLQVWKNAQADACDASRSPARFPNE